MSSHDDARPVSVHDLRAAKERGERFAALTAYDVLTAEALDEAGVPLLLVGDSLGMVVLGHESTLPVTLDEVAHHCRAVRRGVRRALVIADMPFMTFQVSLEDGMRNAGRLIQEGGAHGVKLEGAGPAVDLTARLSATGIPVLGHLGLTPQRVNQLGGFTVQGRDDATAERILSDAVGLEEAGAFAVVLECVPEELARRATDQLAVPTIGIGAGRHTDAQIMVTPDLLGLTRGHRPRFVKPYADLRGVVGDAVKAFRAEVVAGEYPGEEHRY